MNLFARKIIFYSCLCGLIFISACGDDKAAGTQGDVVEEKIDEDLAPPFDPIGSDGEIENPVADPTKDPEPPATEPTTEPTGGGAPPKTNILSFKVSEDCVAPGTQVKLEWATENAAKIMLDRTEVLASGYRTLVADSESSHELVLYNKKGEQQTQQTVNIYHQQETPAGFGLEDTEIKIENPDDMVIAADGTLFALVAGELLSGTVKTALKPVASPNSSISTWQVLAIDPKNSKIMYAGIDGRIYRSIDGGKSWPHVIPLVQNGANLVVNTIHVSPTNPNLVYIGIEGGLYILDTAQPKLTLVTDLDMLDEDVIFVSAYNQNVIAATDTEILLSTNNGSGWNFLASGDWDNVTALKLYEEKIFVGSDQGLFESTIKDPTWTQAKNITSPVVDIAAGKLPGQNQIQYAVATTKGLFYKKADGWENLASDVVTNILPYKEGILFVTPDTVKILNKIPPASASPLCPNKPAEEQML